MRMMIMWAVVPLLIVGAGCSTQNSESEGGPDGSRSMSIQKLDSVVDKALPISAYAISDEQYHQIDLASAKLQRQCMTEYGLSFDYVPSPAPDTRMARRYMSYDLKQVEHIGYHYGAANQIDPRTAGPKLDEDQMLVLLGATRPGEDIGQSDLVGEYNGQEVPAGGCLRKARDQLLNTRGHSLGVNAKLVEQIEDESYASMLKDDRVLAVFKSWSDCMKQKGYNYATPAEANDDPQWQKTEAATAQEKDTAVADVTCKSENNVLGVQFAVESEYNKPLIEENAEALDKIKKLNEARLKAAAKILSGTS